MTLRYMKTVNLKVKFEYLSCMSVNQPVFIIKVRLNEMLFPLKGRETKEKSSRVFALQWNVDYKDEGTETTPQNSISEKSKLS